MSASLILVLIVFIAYSCNQKAGQPAEQETVTEDVSYDAPEWSKNAIIYEVNIRQYTPEGTFKAFEAHLPRLKNLGVDILWLMPIHPISEKNRKGTLGSYYAVADYKGVNPEYGTMEDLKSLVNTAHEMGFYVILDWVANHTGWDNPWIEEHPDWYAQDSTGAIMVAHGWADVAQLNYDNKEVWAGMTDALKYWIVEADIDGYRCDVAYHVPTEYWESARKELTEVKPLFMLAEAEVPEHHDLAFDMSYAWELHHIFNSIARGDMNADSLDAYFNGNAKKFDDTDYRMAFITNHDENSWNGTVEERMGPAAGVMAVLSYTLPGMPLIYSGQEAGLDYALEFFEKDTIQWDMTAPEMEFYTSLNQLKKKNSALWNGGYGAPLKRISTSAAEKVYAFSRAGEDNVVLVVANLSDEAVEVSFEAGDLAGSYREYFSGATTELGAGSEMKLPAWDCRILVK